MSGTNIFALLPDGAEGGKRKKNRKPKAKAKAGDEVKQETDKAPQTTPQPQTSQPAQKAQPQTSAPAPTPATTPAPTPAAVQDKKSEQPRADYSDSGRGRGRGRGRGGFEGDQGRQFQRTEGGRGRGRGERQPFDRSSQPAEGEQNGQVQGAEGAERGRGRGGFRGSRGGFRGGRGGRGRGEGAPETHSDNAQPLDASSEQSDSHYPYERREYSDDSRPRGRGRGRGRARGGRFEGERQEASVYDPTLQPPPPAQEGELSERPEGSSFYRGGRGRRQFERHSGTGRPITGEFKRSGGGRANWGQYGAEAEEGAPESTTGDEAEALKESVEGNDQEKKEEPVVEEIKETDLAEWEKQQQEKKAALQDKLKEQQKEIRKPNDGDSSAFKNLVLHKRDDQPAQPVAPKEKDAKKKVEKKKAIPLSDVFNVQSAPKSAPSPNRDSYAPRGGSRGGRGGFRGGRGGFRGGRGEGAPARDTHHHAEGKAPDFSDAAFPSLNAQPQSSAN